MRNLLLTIPLLLITSCIGTYDPIYQVSGEAPTNQNCKIQVKLSKSGKVISEDSVSGQFKVWYETDDSDEALIDVFAYCNGKEIKSVKGLLPQDETDLDLEMLLP
jgi:hypothetical protein